jgi:hypothetical protein
LSIGPSAHPGDQILQQALRAAGHYQQVEQDPQAVSSVAKVMSQLHAIIAKAHADTQQVMGNPAAARVIGRAFGQDSEQHGVPPQPPASPGVRVAAADRAAP